MRWAKPRSGAGEEQHRAGAEDRERARLGRDGAQPTPSELREPHHRRPMHPQLVRAEQGQGHAKGDQVINDTVREQGTEQLVRRHRAEQQQEHRFEDPHTAWHLTHDAGGDRKEKDGCEGREAHRRLRRQENVEDPRGT